MFRHCLNRLKVVSSAVNLVCVRNYAKLKMAVCEDKLIFRQLFEKETSTFTYLLGCKDTKEAVLIDPVLECVDRDLKILEELGLHLKYGVNTHVHADHITGTGKIKKTLKDCKSVLGSKSGAKADVFVDQDAKLKFGNLVLECRETPGHTNGCTTYVLHDHQMAFTGDALLIRGCGRTDFQQGSSHKLYHSIHSQIYTLPLSYKLYPAHDYKGWTVTTVGEEKKYNLRVNHTEEEFIEIMKNLNLSRPKYIDISLPANMVCGIQELYEA